MTEPRPARRLHSLLWVLAALIVLAIIVWQAATWTAPLTGTEDRVAVDGEPGLTIYAPEDRVSAPRVEGTTLDGEPFALSDWIGKIVVINVWGSWCGPCRAETPDLVRLANEDAPRGVRFVGINTRDNPATAQAFVRNYEVPYPSVRDDDGQVLADFVGVIPTAVVPSTVIVDRHGDVAARVIGPVTYSTLKGLLDDEITETTGRP